ncbi:hypothetical protein FHS85_001464 [Rhodoligotrophos appendicifer]|uniref:hypothetical protein n=1 Tax=Rhodoligotrophos appendicifer TaxID=987056 RepID=UPI001184956E|nr:hypothetical protein [Rhodoligotrophos appendicifer]
MGYTGKFYGRTQELTAKLNNDGAGVLTKVGTGGLTLSDAELFFKSAVDPIKKSFVQWRNSFVKVSDLPAKNAENHFDLMVHPVVSGAEKLKAHLKLTAGSDPSTQASQLAALKDELSSFKTNADKLLSSISANEYGYGVNAQIAQARNLVRQSDDGTGEPKARLVLDWLAQRQGIGGGVPLAEHLRRLGHEEEANLLEAALAKGAGFAAGPAAAAHPGAAGAVGAGELPPDLVTVQPFPATDANMIMG